LLSIKQTGGTKIVTRLKLLVKGKNLDKMWSEAGDIAENHARDLSPVDTGELHASIHVEDIKHGFILSADAEHAIFNEYGSITTPIGSVNAPKPAKYYGYRPFMRPAILRVMREIPILFNKYTQEIFTNE
jgi:hypothetical protein